MHPATLDLLAQHGRAALTVPLIAARAGVTPSTIYRRWGELSDLLADVALERRRPVGDSIDTGTVAGDLRVWVERYREEMSSDPGIGMLLDALAAKGSSAGPNKKLVPRQCAAFAASQIEDILARGITRGESVPEVDAVMDTVVAPIVYRALFGFAPVTPQQVQDLLTVSLSAGRKSKELQTPTHHLRVHRTGSVPASCQRVTHQRC